jgi:hypothetical protein
VHSLPYDFAAHLFDLTKLGMRVIVAPSDVAPLSIVHPALFQPRPDARDAAAARVAEAQEATKKADQARLAVLTASREVAQATMPLRRMRNLKLREEERLADADHAIISADSIEAKEAAEAVKANSTAKIAELDAQLAPAEAELQPKINALAAAREAAAAAEAARAEAAQAANAIARALEPMSVFISRKTQRLYVRQVAIGFTGVRRLEMRIPIGSGTGFVKCTSNRSACWLKSACNARPKIKPAAN